MRNMMLATCVVLLGMCSSAWAVCTTATIAASTPTSDFIDNNDGTVTHKKTGLQWKKCAEGLSGASCATGTAATYAWQAALNQAVTVNAGAGFAGHTDWRVPNIKELMSIIEDQCSSPAVNEVLFPATPAASFWTSSPSMGLLNGFAWHINFADSLESIISMGTTYHLRLVRGGK